MRTYFDLSYSASDTASPSRLLDIYLPDTDGFDTILWFHGGGLEGGSYKDDSYAAGIVSKGYAFVSAEYRMYPDACFPDYVEDAAAAVAYILKQISSYGGSGKLYISGTSAGAYLTMLLCLDQHYLRDAGICQEQIAGYISDSAQQFCHYNVLRELGQDRRLERIDEHAPIFYINSDLRIRPLLLLYYSDDIKCRPEENRLLYTSLQKLLPECNVHISELPGPHCCQCQDENGEYLFVKRMLEFIASLSD